jgi:single-strand DNA-binding protein
MASLNKVMLIGNVTRDPEVKFTPKGSAVADLGLAVNRIYTNQAGERVEEVTYVDVELWGRLAEIAGEYAKKGRPVFIEGRLRMDSWEDKQSGQKRTRLRVVADGLQLLGSRPAGAPGGADEEAETPSAKPASQAPARSALGPPADDDIPF